MRALRRQQAPRLDRLRSQALAHAVTGSAACGRGLGPRAVEAATPVPLAAVLLGFVVMQFGIPGQEQLATPGGWATAYR